MKVLVYIETKEGAPVPGSLELLTAAKELGETVAVAAEDKAAAEKAAAYAALQTSPESAAGRGYVDAVIEPESTRQHLIAAFEMLYSKRAVRPSKKHSTL